MKPTLSSMGALGFALCFLILASASSTVGGSSEPSFESDGPFNFATAYTNLLYSYAAYCSESSLQYWDCTWCQNSSVVSHFEPFVLITNSDTNTFGYVGKNPQQQQVVVVFRGTEESSLDNWITDLSFAQTTLYSNVPYAEVHSGFYEAYLSVATDVNSAVYTLMNENPGYQLVITGHSLGAALATLCAINLTQSYNDIMVYTYGCPRVGNDYFAAFYESYIGVNWRLTNDDDIVPHLPPENLGFFHTTTEEWYNGNNWVTCNRTYGEDPYCADSVSVFDYSISDHLDYFGIHESCY